MKPRKSDLEDLKGSCVSEIDDSHDEHVIKKVDSQAFLQVPEYRVNVQTLSGTGMVDSDKEASSRQENSSIKNSFNTNKSYQVNPALIHSKMTSYQLRLAGLSSMTVNSFAETINQSKINRVVEESVVMQDYFNPAKTLLDKWGNQQQYVEMNRFQ